MTKNPLKFNAHDCQRYVSIPAILLSRAAQAIKRQTLSGGIAREVPDGFKDAFPEISDGLEQTKGVCGHLIWVKQLARSVNPNYRPDVILSDLVGEIHRFERL